jgi:hypothetical protein
MAWMKCAYCGNSVRCADIAEHLVVRHRIDLGSHYIQVMDGEPYLVRVTKGPDGQVDIRYGYPQPPKIKLRNSLYMVGGYLGKDGLYPLDQDLVRWIGRHFPSFADPKPRRKKGKTGVQSNESKGGAP